MALTERTLVASYGSPNKKRLVRLTGTFTIGSAGAISANTDASKSGGTITKNAAAGRYDVVFYKTFKLVQGFGATMCGPASSAFPTTTGSTPQTRSVATTGMTVQFIRTDTQADADAASGTIGCWWADVET